MSKRRHAVPSKGYHTLVSKRRHSLVSKGCHCVVSKGRRIGKSLSLLVKDDSDKYALNFYNEE